MWRTLPHWMEASGLGTAPRKLLEELAEARSLDVVLPTGGGTELRLWTVSRTETQLAILPQRLGLVLPGRSRPIIHFSLGNSFRPTSALPHPSSSS